jgi:hypothetical protein
MLKFFFWVLLLANAALFAYRDGYLDTMLPSGREPGRMSDQLNADKIKLIPASAAADADVPAAREEKREEEKNTEVTACTEIGNFSADDAKRFEARLAALSLRERVSRRSIQEAVTHMVYIPSQGDKDGADRKAAELRRLGIDDFFIIQDNSPLRWAISLGVFKVEEKARAHLVNLSRKGVRSARIGPYNVTTTMVAFQLRELNADMKAGVEKIKADFPKQEMRACEAV